MSWGPNGGRAVAKSSRVSPPAISAKMLSATSVIECEVSNPGAKTIRCPGRVRGPDSGPETPNPGLERSTQNPRENPNVPELHRILWVRIRSYGASRAGFGFGLFTFEFRWEVSQYATDEEVRGIGIPFFKDPLGYFASLRRRDEFPSP